MDTLPSEILQHIFLFLSPRYRLHCSLVCKTWFLASQQPIFYHTITIYRYSQLIKFLQLARTVKINNKLIGHLVRRLILKELYNNHILTYEEVEELHDACPFLTFIDDIRINDENDQEQHDLYMIPYWQYLTEIRLWYSKNDTYRLHSIKHGPLLTSLQLDIKDIIITNEIHQKQHHDMDKNKKEEGEEQEKKEIKYIQIQHDIQPQIQANYQYYYGRVILFPSYLIHLKELYLCFKSVSYRSSVAEYRLDERTLESLHQSCPSLESLSLNYLVLNCLEIISRSLSVSSTSKTIMTISPCQSLKHLYLMHCKLYQYGNYAYLSKKYPQLTTLHLNLQWKDDQHLASALEENDILLRYRHDQRHLSLNSNAINNSQHHYLHHNHLIQMNSMDPNHHTYRYMIYELITSFQYLKELSAEFIYVNDFSNVKWQDGLWPSKELLHWLIQHPHQLQVLNYPYDLSTMEYDMKKNWQHGEEKEKEVTKKRKDNNNNKDDDDDGSYSYFSNYYDMYDVFQRRAYLDHLTTLILNIEEEFSYTLHYLLRDGKRKIASSSITTLTIKKEKGIMTHFFLFDWLDAFPNLKSLTLSGVGLIDDKEHQHQHHDDNEEEEEEEEENHDDHQNENEAIVVEENQWDHLKYKLKELIISSSSIFLMGGLSMICKVCPSLRILKLAYVDFFGYLTPLEQTPQQMPYVFLNRIYCIVIDAPHLVLDEFSISSVRCGAYWKQFNEAEMTELIVDEVGDGNNNNNNNNNSSSSSSSSDHIIRIVEPSKLKPPTNVVLRCKSVDIVNYSNNH